jgi:hypothetical protein
VGIGDYESKLQQTRDGGGGLESRRLHPEKPSSTVCSSSQIMTDTFTVTGSQGNHSISLIPVTVTRPATEYSVSFSVA